MNVDAWLSGEEGTRVVEAAAKALHDAQFFIAGDGQPAIRVLADEEAATVALRAALSLTTTCKTCGGNEGEAMFHVNADGIQESTWVPCPDCEGGTVPGEPYLVARSMTCSWETYARVQDELAAAEERVSD